MTDLPPPPAPPSDRDLVVVDSPYEIANWRPLAQWVLFIPHLAIMWVLRSAAGVVFVVYWLALLFTGRLQRGLYEFMCMYERYSTRATGFLLGYSEVYPPFDFEMGPTDNRLYPPMHLDLPPVPEGEVERKAAANIILAIPHYLVLVVFWIAAAVVAIIGWFAVLFTGRWPQGMRDFLVQVTNYHYRIWTYVAMVRTEYPRFGL